MSGGHSLDYHTQCGLLLSPLSWESFPKCSKEICAAGLASVARFHMCFSLGKITFPLKEEFSGYPFTVAPSG
jgi:hypothetical protein